MKNPDFDREQMGKSSTVLFFSCSFLGCFRTGKSDSPCPCLGVQGQEFYGAPRALIMAALQDFGTVAFDPQDVRAI